MRQTTRSWKKPFITEPRVRASVWDKTHGVCWYCGEKLNPWRDFCIDHVIPLSGGGADELDNLVPCCRKCNRVKSNRSLEQFRVQMGRDHGVFFTKEQEEYLARHDIKLPDPEAYIFYYEHIGIENKSED